MRRAWVLLGLLALLLGACGKYGVPVRSQPPQRPAAAAAAAAEPSTPSAPDSTAPDDPEPEPEP